MLVSILRQGDFLIASIHTALDDTELLRFQQDVVAQIGKNRSRGVIVDVAALDVLDSYGSLTLRNLAASRAFVEPSPSSSASSPTWLSRSCSSA